MRDEIGLENFQDELFTPFQIFNVNNQKVYLLKTQKFFQLRGIFLWDKFVYSKQNSSVFPIIINLFSEYLCIQKWQLCYASLTNFLHVQFN